MNINKEIQLTANYFKVDPSKIRKQYGTGERHPKLLKFFITYMLDKRTNYITEQALARLLGFENHTSIVFHNNDISEENRNEYLEYFKMMYSELKSSNEPILIYVSEHEQALNDQIEYIRKRLLQFKGQSINETLIDEIIG